MKPRRPRFDPWPPHSRQLADVLGTGRQARLRPVWEQSRGSSTLPVRTQTTHPGIVLRATGRPCTPRREGSTPSGSITYPRSSDGAECRASNAEVAGSSPAGGTTSPHKQPWEGTGHWRAQPAVTRPPLGCGGSTPSLPTADARSSARRSTALRRRRDAGSNPAGRIRSMASGAWGSAGFIRLRQAGSIPALATVTVV